MTIFFQLNFLFKRSKLTTQFFFLTNPGNTSKFLFPSCIPMLLSIKRNNFQVLTAIALFHFFRSNIFILYAARYFVILVFKIYMQNLMVILLDKKFALNVFPIIFGSFFLVTFRQPKFLFSNQCQSSLI